MFSYIIGSKTGNHVYHSRDNVPPNDENCYKILLLCAPARLEEDTQLFEGDIIFTPPGRTQALRLDGDCAYLLFKFEPALIACAKNLLPDGAKNVRETVIPSGLAIKHGLREIFLQIQKYAVSGNDESDFMIMTYAMQLITKIGEIQKHEHAANSSKKNLRILTDYISSNLCSQLTLDSIAQYMYMDKSYICRLFKREMGITINAYINSQRVFMATDLISSGMPPREAYTRCGFNDYSTFYRAFKKHTRMTPEEFKRKPAYKRKEL